ncbi:MAG: hypothetical protein F6K31_30430 [Symploca sp. SIO2G7]|nr:hypothetical protein [Symploca sp. SIO2G7]
MKIEPLKVSDKVIELSEDQLLPGNTWGDSATRDRLLKIVPDSRDTKEEDVVDAILSDSSSPSELSSPGEVLQNILPNLTGGGILPVKYSPDRDKGIGKGFEGSLNLNLMAYPQLLPLLKPGAILNLNESIGYGSGICRSYRIGGVRLSGKEMAIASTIDFYLPVSIRQPSPESNSQDTFSYGASGTPLEPPVTGRFMRYVATGQKRSSGAYIYILQLVEGTTVLESMQTINGFIGKKPITRSKDREGSGRPIPEGVFPLGEVYQVPAGQSLGTGLGRLFISIDDTLPRSEIGIHWDENLNDATAGCIGCLTQADVFRALEWKEQQGVTVIQVNYGDFLET